MSGKPEALAAEAADLLYQLLELWPSSGLESASVAAELRRRQSSSDPADQEPVDT